ncbi:MAG: peptidase, partial [Caulobacteraceae bacterium]|nr:peptidase [Caulobacteraceae bacterium]
MGRFLALLAALILGGLVAWAELQPPRTTGLDTPATAFSGDRAMSDVRTIATVPHPVGSLANQRVRDYLLSRLTALGLDPQLRRERVYSARQVDGLAQIKGGRVENIIGVLPGRDRAAPALVLMAHYDSVANSPGASDDATGVAAILETVRALKARGVPARDVIVLITYGEEAGLLGARAFFQHDPLRRRVGLVMNLESRGSAGRVQMFETGADNGGTIDLLRRTAVRPSSSSLAVMIYGLMPNDTDFSEARQAGAAGLNYAYLGRQFDYHSPTAT